MKDQILGTEGPTPRLITIEEAARRLSIGRSHIYAQIQTRALRSVKIGRSRRILETDLDTFIQELLDEPVVQAKRAYVAPPRPPVKALPLRRGRR